MSLKTYLNSENLQIELFNWCVFFGFFQATHHLLELFDLSKEKFCRFTSSYLCRKDIPTESSTSPPWDGQMSNKPVGRLGYVSCNEIYPVISGIIS